MPHGHREEKIEDMLKNAAAEFIQRESNRLSLITVTRVMMSDKLRRATILFTVLPETMEKDALEFLKRKRADFREYIVEKTRIQRLPSVNFDVDYGEKNRQRIDEISSTSTL